MWSPQFQNSQANFQNTGSLRPLQMNVKASKWDDSCVIGYQKSETDSQNMKSLAMRNIEPFQRPGTEYIQA